MFTHARQTGFTLVEILIVVVILGILAAAVIPTFANMRDGVEQTAFISDVRIFAQAAQLYHVVTGEYLEDSSSGKLPRGWESYVEKDAWESLTPIGGVWDMEYNSYGIVSGFGVDFANGGGANRDDAYMQGIDEMFDDGNLTTGSFRKIATGRYYFILRD